MHPSPPTPVPTSPCSGRVLLLLLLSACAYEVPVDPDGPDILSTITGTVVASGVETLGPVAVLLFAADDPPPPVGTGSPASFAMVPASLFSGGGGLLSAPFVLSEIPDGDWIISGLMDVDGDFQPQLSSHAGATCGDHAGVYPVSATDSTPAVISIADGQRVDGVSVVLAAQYPTERPAFVFTADTVQQTAPQQVISLAATGIHSEVLELADPGTPCGVLFLVRFLDDDGDGVPDPHPTYGDAAFAAWPKIYLQYTGEGDVPLAAGESYAAEAVVSPLLWAGLGGPATAGVTLPTTALDAIFVPAALHTSPDGAQETVTAPNLPRGAWSVTVVLETGQTWTLPNEIAGFPPTIDGFDPTLQAGTLLVQ